MRSEVAVLSTPLSFCFKHIALRASINTQISKSVSFSLRTVNTSAQWHLPLDFHPRIFRLNVFRKQKRP